MDTLIDAATSGTHGAKRGERRDSTLGYGERRRAGHNEAAATLRGFAPAK